MSLSYLIDDTRTRKRQEVKEKRRRLRVKRYAVLFSVLMILCLACLSAVTITGNALIDEKKIEQLQHPAKSDSHAYVPIQQMPDYVWEAFIAIEDQRYMSHFGVDPIGLVRAAWTDIKEGTFAQGGSTITMQLARNLYLSIDKTITRKFKEMIIAVNLERKYSKKEILEMY
ncbi:transglycosylase [Scopulibacillus darangshiensis]|uniref:Transglycosylase n=1 Tax=Scopulibacillus darangshiensis TaxID=442528 RepID=A0A4R2P440_9BACL|nr:transglycosylase [Scopulibacillus darangshiensis]